MILSIHQPSYFPWLGLLHKIAKSDLYMVMDEVQLTDSAYQHRNLFLSANGNAKYLTIPFSKANYLKRPFNALEIRDPSWRTDHINFLKNGYRKHPFFAEIFPILADFYHADYPLLIDAVMASMNICLTLFDIRTKVVFQSDAEYDRSQRRGDLVLSLVRNSGADCYLSGTGAKVYLDEASFADGLSLKYDQFTHPEYPQKNASRFIPGLSSLDMLFNLGVSESRRLVNSGR